MIGKVMTEDFVLEGRDLADALRMEISGVPPSAEKKLKGYVLKLKGSIERKFGKYFGPNTLNKVRGLEERVVTFPDRETYKDYLTDVVGIGENEKPEDIDALFHQTGDVNYITQTTMKGLAEETLKRKETPVEIKTELEQGLKRLAEARNIPIDEAARIYGGWVFRNQQAHEVSHAYEDKSLPLYFRECGVQFYRREMLNDIQDLSLNSPDWDEKIKFYEQLIARYGDVVHGIYFGSNQDAGIKNRILGSFTKSVMAKLYPDGYGFKRDEDYIPASKH
jgi:hypothetical protein